MTIEIYQVGGSVRDEIMGIDSHDIDFSVVAPSFEDMRQYIVDNGLKIVVETPQFATIRAVAPRSGFLGFTGGLDFVWARQDGPYSDGRRPDWTKPGTLETDLARRDFTFNAIAKDAEGNFIDPHNGRQAIAERYIQAVGDPHERLAEDALRAVRALRFSVTLGFRIRHELAFAMQTARVLDALKTNISSERIKDELNKMLAADTLGSLRAFDQFPELTRVMFSGRISLEATMKERKGR